MNNTNDTPLEDNDIARQARFMCNASNFTFDGLVIAHFSNVIDVIQLNIEKEKIGALSNKIGEPILLTMGDKDSPIDNPYIEQLFIPHNKRTVKYIADSSLKGDVEFHQISSREEDGYWLHPITLDNKGSTILASDILKNATSISRSDATEKPKFELVTMDGQNITEIKDHLIKLAQHGLSVRADFDGTILQSDQLLAQKNQQKPEPM